MVARSRQAKCRMCGCAKDLPRKHYCATCRTKRNELLALKRRRRCKNCGAEKETKNIYRCDKCWAEAQLDRKANSHRRNYLKNKLKIQNRRLIGKYGITLEDYDKKFSEQEYKCAICKVQHNSGEKRFAVDHDHVTGKIRGILCKKCNIGLGEFRDCVEYLNSAVAYLQKYSL